MTPATLQKWQKAMRLTQQQAASALGASLAAYKDWITGKSRNTGKPIEIEKRTALACAAIAIGLQEWTEQHEGKIMGRIQSIIVITANERPQVQKEKTLRVISSFDQKNTAVAYFFGKFLFAQTTWAEPPQVQEILQELGEGIYIEVPESNGEAEVNLECVNFFKTIGVDFPNANYFAVNSFIKEIFTSKGSDV